MAPFPRLADVFTPRWPLPATDTRALARVFGVAESAVAGVEIYPDSWFCRLHGRWVAATTRANRVYTSLSGPAFAANPELVVHEFCHVLRQWNPGRLTAWRYLWENATNGDGYRGNKYEVEARAFAAEHAGAFARLRRAFADGGEGG